MEFLSWLGDMVDGPFLPLLCEKLAHIDLKFRGAIFLDRAAKVLDVLTTRGCAGPTRRRALDGGQSWDGLP